MVVPAPELLSVNVTVIPQMGMIAVFRKGCRATLIGHFPDHRTAGRRRSRRCRLYGLLDTGRLGGLAELPDRSIRNRDHQHDSGDDGA
jgi:hypothetical protein